MSEGWQDRLRQEELELRKRADLLCAFMQGSDAFNELPVEERVLLGGQFGAMTAYLCFLSMRIARLG